MPNGEPNFDYKDMELFFAPIADAVHDFARQRNLLIDKYYHDGRDWALRFSHPQGGIGCVTIRRDQEDRLWISSHWCFDDYDKFTRFIHGREEDEYPRDSSLVREALQKELESIIAVQFGAWNAAFRDFQNSWSVFTKEQFQALGRKFPVPTMD